MNTGQGDSLLGAYGLRLSGLEAASELLVPVTETAPAYAIEAKVGRPAPDPSSSTTTGRELLLRSGGRILIDRRRRRVSFVVPHEVRPDELVHPYLAPAAAVIGRWHGRESIHAGAFAVDGGVWGVVGEREAGKSSTLAWLAWPASTSCATTCSSSTAGRRSAARARSTCAPTPRSGSRPARRSA